MLALAVQPMYGMVASRVARAATTVSSQAELLAALAGSDTTITLGSDITVTNQINIGRTVTLEGNGHVLKPTFTATGGGNDTVLAVIAGSPTLDRVAVEGSAGTNLQGIQVWNSAATLKNPVVRNNDKAGIHVNNSTVTVLSATTSNNGANYGGMMLSSGILTVNGQSFQAENTNWTGKKMDIYRTGGTVVDTQNQYTNWLNTIYTLKPVAPAVPTGLDYLGDQNCGGFTNINHTQPTWDAVANAVSYDYQALYNGAVVFSTNYSTNQHPGGTFGGGQNGIWGFQVRSVGANGLKSSWSPVCAITLDTVIPTATLSYTPAGPAKTKNNVTVTLTASEPIQQSALPGTWLRVSDTIYKKAFSLNSVQNVTLKDLAGNIGEAIVMIDWIDKTAPHYAISSPQTGDVLATALQGNKLIVRGSFDDNPGGSGVNYIQFQLVKDGSGLAVVTKHGAVSNDTLAEFDTTGLADGEYYVNVLGAVDGVGNWAPTASIKVLLDNTAPSATITHSNNNDATLVNTDVISTLVATEPIQTPVGWTKVNDTTFTKVSTANNKGNMTITDLAGNSTVKFFEIKRIDKTAPVFNVADGTVLDATSFEVIATEDNISSISIDGVTTPYTGTKPNYRVTVNGVGVHTVIATDKAGNVTTVNFTLSDGMVLTIDPVDGSSANPVISGTVTWRVGGPAANQTVAVQIKQGDTAIQNFLVTTDLDGKWASAVPAALANGTYAIVAVAGDDSTTLTPVVIAAANEENPSTSENPSSQNPPKNTSGGNSPGVTGVLETLSQQPLISIAGLQPSVRLAAQFAQFLPSTNSGTAAIDTSTVAADTPSVLGVGDFAVKTDEPDVKGASTEKSWLASFLSFWWVLPLIAALGSLWWFIAARRRRQQDQV